MSGGFYFECPACTKVHPVDIEDQDAWPDRNCHTCLDEGCRDCVCDETGLCLACSEDKGRFAA